LAAEFVRFLIAEGDTGILDWLLDGWLREGEESFRRCGLDGVPFGVYLVLEIEGGEV
jgi:hypothetical protein